MREHKWNEMKTSIERVKKFLESYVSPEPLSPRSALYGGRTSALRLRYSTPPGESVHYVDVTSLYPYVNANCSYPLQHPKITCEDFNDSREYFGICISRSQELCLPDQNQEKSRRKNERYNANSRVL